jgi:hypothetical protein
MRDTPGILEDIYDELVLAVDDSIPATGEGYVMGWGEESPTFTKNIGWVKVPLVQTLQQVVCRISNRVFVGTPLCSYRPTLFIQRPVLTSHRSRSKISSPQFEICNQCYEVCHDSQNVAGIS